MVHELCARTRVHSAEIGISTHDAFVWRCVAITINFRFEIAYANRTCSESVGWLMTIEAHNGLALKSTRPWTDSDVWNLHRKENELLERENSVWKKKWRFFVSFFINERGVSTFEHLAKHAHLSKANITQRKFDVSIVKIILFIYCNSRIASFEFVNECFGCVYNPTKCDCVSDSKCKKWKIWLICNCNLVLLLHRVLTTNVYW